MNTYSFAALFAFLAVANAGVLVAPSAKIIQGPSTRTTVVGPDGSAISSVAPAGQIVQEESVGVVAQTAPVVAASAPALAYSAPLVAHSAPAVAYSAPALAYSAPLAYAAPAHVAYSAPLVSAYSAPVVSSGVVGHSTVDTVISGPSGTIATGKTVAAAPVVAAW
ncbi:cuticle protein 16.5-like isoform X2 [Anthonomus grandis grandis]|uniref:cuticle protein 16.5-like isoform X1 n=1 Tax=Anthonomus grandis grandis TaxID=2921223 RepID=UPI002166BF76|nr:cuticle protein 16.5-like isoform X1 [Anthonomus grandis grandis]XP_050294697.1 cuticle protein 16.5-like isoform X2 [Anthonomus grandis grandis]